MNYKFVNPSGSKQLAACSFDSGKLKSHSIVVYLSGV